MGRASTRPRNRSQYERDVLDQRRSSEAAPEPRYRRSRLARCDTVVAEHGTSHGGHHGAAGSGQARQSRSQPGTRTWTPTDIKSLYERHRRGQIGDEAFRKAEQDLFAAQKDGRLIAPIFMTK